VIMLPSEAAGDRKSETRPERQGRTRSPHQLKRFALRPRFSIHRSSFRWAQGRQNALCTDMHLSGSACSSDQYLAV
jgi:hypothetical protein